MLCVRRDGRVAMAGDGQVTLDKTVMKSGARKVRRLAEGRVLAGFAGATADAFTLFELFEKKLKERMKILLNRRKSTQPLTLPNAGSVFKNPAGDYAGRLIEESGLRGARIGGACVSDVHANFIVNVEGARASDILALIHRVQERVEATKGIRLETEVRVVGVEPPGEEA